MTVPCNRCEILLLSWDVVSAEAAACPVCGAESTLRVYPAVQSSHRRVRTESAAEGEAACYDHPSKRAVGACSQCGRYVCQLCSVELRGETWCPGCVAAGSRQAKVAELENSRTLYDSLALATAVVPLLMWPFTFLTAPAALYLALRYWKRPLSVVRRTRWRYIAAIVIALAQIAAWIFGVAFFVTRWKATT